MGAVVETEWRELVHKLPPTSPQRYGIIRAARAGNTRTPETQPGRLSQGSSKRRVTFHI